MSVRIFFFDSHGHLWVTCDTDETGREAFGPLGVARRADPDEAGLLVGDETPWRAAKEAGRLAECGDWDALVPVVRGHRIEAGADLSDANLRGADLSEFDLRGADFRGADLSWADLRGTDLRGADFRGASLREASFAGANLAGANLEGTDLSGLDFAGADLRGADLRGANMNDAWLEGATVA